MSDMKRGEENEASGPGDGADPIGADEGGGFMGAEFSVLGDLDEGGGGPDGGEKEGGNEVVLPVSEEEAGGAGAGLEEHEGGDDVGHLFGVVTVVGVEIFWGDAGKEGIDRDLDDPDDAGHGGAGDELDEEEGFEHLGEFLFEKRDGVKCGVGWGGLSFLLN